MNWVGTKKPATRGDPTFAALLTWLVPGAGHLYLKQPLFALAAFSVVAGLYLLGLSLSEGMLFEFLQPDLRGPFAGALTPEAANLGALIWHMREYGYGLLHPRPWPEHVHLGVWLTATSGLLNACLMVRAHVDARQPLEAGSTASARPVLRWTKHPATLVLLGWIVPGLGHFVQGRRRRGAIVFILLVGLVVLGSSLAAGSNLDRERHFYYWGGQFLAGGPVMLLEGLHGHARITGEIPYVDAGLVLAAIGGLLNILALLDVYGSADRRLDPAGSKDPPREALGATA
jgi:TM2 domain-containing membrane protein YozV